MASFNHLGSNFGRASPWYLPGSVPRWLDYPVEEHLNTEKNLLTLLDRCRVQVPGTEDVSNSYEYFPIIFLKDRAFSGFDQEVRKAIEQEISDYEVEAPPAGGPPLPPHM